MFVATFKKEGKNKTYITHYIAESYRNEDGNPRNKLLLNISNLPYKTIQAIKVALRGGNIIEWDKLEGLESRSFGLSYAALKTLEKIGLPEILGDDGKRFWSTIAAMVVNRIDDPCSKYSLKNWIMHNALPQILGESGESCFHHNRCYQALDWLAGRQTELEDRLYDRRDGAGTLFLYDITSSYFEGMKAELGEFGYSRDHRKDLKQVCIGLLGDADGLPYAVEVFPGNVRDSTTVPAQIAKMKTRFACEKAVFVGDRGMMTSANKEQLARAGLDFVLALTNREVLKLVETHGPLQMGLFDERGLADVVIDERRMVVCRNPIAGDDTKRRRERLLELSEEKLRQIEVRVKSGRLRRAAPIQRAVDRWLPHWATEKFFELEIADDVFKWRRNVETLAAAERLDGVYVLETTTVVDDMPAEKVQRVYKNLQQIERAFRCMKGDIEVRPIYHRKESRIRGHIFVCLLAYWVEQMWRNALDKVPKDRRFEWATVKELLRGWHRVSVNGQSRLKPHDANFTPETAKLLSILEIQIP